MDLIKWMIGLIGHIGLWCVVFNRIHATSWPRSTRKLSEKAILMAVALPIAWVASLLCLRKSLDFNSIADSPYAFFYLYGCILLGLFFVCRWVWRKCYLPLPKAVVETKTEWLDLRTGIEKPLLHGRFATILGYVPFNEVLNLTLQRMTFALDVPESLDGLKICHLSDLHFTGQIGIEYFQRVVEEANQFDPDLIVVTGDLVDEVECLSWLEPTLGRLRSKLGSYYVLGNHDRRMKDESDLRSRLEKCGMIKTSGRWLETSHQGARIQITGNEMPWYRDSESLPEPPAEKVDLRILLSHSPDQIDWAMQRGFHLMFAGHTHGGQIALPVFGPIVAPSKYGVKYASGTFQIDHTLMHVSRGISGDEPIRFCSPPELGLITIRAKKP